MTSSHPHPPSHHDLLRLLCRLNILECSLQCRPLRSLSGLREAFRSLPHRRPVLDFDKTGEAEEYPGAAIAMGEVGGLAAAALERSLVREGGLGGESMMV